MLLRQALRFVICAVVLALPAVAVPSAQCAAAAPRFPWHAHPGSRSATPIGRVPVQTLSPPATAPVEALPSKQAYPYGWFGAAPSHQWKRSFGVSKAYTQWSRY